MLWSSVEYEKGHKETDKFLDPRLREGDGKGEEIPMKIHVRIEHFGEHPKRRDYRKNINRLRQIRQRSIEHIKKIVCERVLSGPDIARARVL